MPYITSHQFVLTSGQGDVMYIPVPPPLEKATILSARAAYDNSVSSSATLTFVTGASSTTTGVITVTSAATAGSIIDYVETTSSSAHKTIATAASHALKITATDHGGTAVNPVITIEWDEFVRT